MLATETIPAYLDGLPCAVSLSALIGALPEHTPDEIKAATRALVDDRAINRVSVRGNKGPNFFVFYSLRVPTTYVHAAAPAAKALPENLSPDEAVELLGRAGWQAEPEIVEVVPIVAERRAPDRRRLTVLEVIARWRLSYPLGRLVEIIAGARRGGMSRDDAALAIRMIREHVKTPD